MPTWPDGVTLVTIRHTPVTTGGRTYRGLVTARASERLFEADRPTGGDSSILPADASTNIEPDGSWEIQLPAVDAGILPEGAAYWLVEHVAGAEGKGVWVAPMTHHAPGPVGLADVMTSPPAKGGGITIQTGPATDASMAEIAEDPDSEFRTSLSGVITPVATTTAQAAASAYLASEPGVIDAAALAAAQAIDDQGGIQDPIIASAVTDTASATRAALGVATERSTGLVDVRRFGAAWDGVTDDTAALNAAAAHARTQGGRLYLPAGQGRIAGRVDVYTSVVCDGEILISGGSIGQVVFSRSRPEVILDPDDFPDLEAGATRMSGLPAGQTGALYLQNTQEEIIKRWSGTTQTAYYKSEASSVIHPGVLGEPLANSYVDRANLYLAFYPIEPRMVVDGLRILIDGTGSVSTGGRVLISRSWVTFNGLEIANVSGVDQQSPCIARWCVDVVFNDPKIGGFYHSDGGYGIMGSSTAGIVVNNGEITGCRHAISGQKNKTLRVNGGRYEGGIDDHWTYGMAVEGITSTIRPGHTTPSHVHVAGQGGVTVTDSTLIGGNTIISIRSDTPELADEVLVEGVRFIGEDSSHVTGIRYYSTSLPDRDYGRPYLHTPSRTTFRNCDVGAPSTADVYIINAVGPSFEHYGWGEIVVDDVRLTSGHRMRVYVDPAPHLRPVDDPGPVIRVRSVSFPAGTGLGDSSVWVQNNDPTAATAVQAARVEITDCENVRVAITEDVVGSMRIERSSVLGVARSGTKTAIPMRATIRDSRMVSLYATGFWRADFIDNTWEGAVQNSNLSMDGRAISYRGNLHALDATGHPSRPDGYVNPDFYKTA